MLIWYSDCFVFYFFFKTSNEICDRVKEDYYALGCISSDCEQGWIECNEDEDCSSVAESYWNACQIVLNGTWDEDWCPSSCSYWLAVVCNINIILLFYYLSYNTIHMFVKKF